MMEVKRYSPLKAALRIMLTSGTEYRGRDVVSVPFYDMSAIVCARLQDGKTSILRRSALHELAVSPETVYLDALANYDILDIRFRKAKKGDDWYSKDIPVYTLTTEEIVNGAALILTAELYKIAELMDDDLFAFLKDPNVIGLVRTSDGEAAKEYARAYTKLGRLSQVVGEPFVSVRGLRVDRNAKQMYPWELQTPIYKS